MSTWLIVGATSGIATPLARELASRGNRLFLAGRDNERLALLADDIRARFSVEVAVGLPADCSVVLIQKHHVRRAVPL